MYEQLFLKSLLKNNQFFINNKRVLSFDMPQMILPLDSFVLLQNTLKRLEGSKVNQFFYLSGKIFGKNLLNEQIKRLGFKKDISSFQHNLRELELSSMGKSDLIKFDVKNKKVIIKNSNSPLANRYMRLFGVQKEPVDHYLRGIYTGIAEVILDCEMASIESKCIARGDGACLIEIKQKDDFEDNLKNEEIKICEEKLAWPELLAYAENSKIPNPVTQKLLGFEHLMVENGWLRMVKIPIIVIPTNIFALLQQAGWKTTNEVLYHVGKIHGMKSTTTMAGVFGFHKDKKLLEMMFQQAGLIGIGNMDVKSFDFEGKKASLSSENNTLARQSYSLFGKQNTAIDHFTKGLVAGACEVIFEEKMSCKEVTCLAKGDKKCIFIAEKGDNKEKGFICIDETPLKFDCIFEQA